MDIEEEKKVINLKNRFKYTFKELDFTIIEILKEDNIYNFLEVDEYINSDEYKDQQIFSVQFPEGRQLQYSQGKIVGKLNKYFKYSLGTKGGSSGSPIILIKNLKLIGLHKGKIKYNNSDKIGIPINLIINKINFIKCIYNIEKENVGKEIQIINNRYYDYNGDLKVNEEIGKKIKIIINGEAKSNTFRYIFTEEGKYNIYLVIDSLITNISCLFNSCNCLEEINLSTFDTTHIIYMQYIFYNCFRLKKGNFSNLNSNNLNNMEYMFSECSSLDEIDLSSFKADNVINMRNMFKGCKNIKNIKLISLKANNVIDMSGMFSGCYSLKEINLSSFNMNNVNNIEKMFYYCSSLEKIEFSPFMNKKIKNMKN